MLKNNTYTWTGLGLLIAGILVSVSAQFILHFTWLTALGISMLILSLILLALGKTIPRLSPEAASLLLETGIDNIAAIIEELGIRTRAIYLPSSLTGGRPQALIPLHSNSSPPAISRPLPQRLIVRYGNSPDEIGLLLSTIGSMAIGMMELKPGPAAAELETALNNLFSGTLGIADRTRVTYNESNITVEIKKPRIENRATWSQQCLGGPLASIAASAAAEAWDRPVAIRQEELQGEDYLIEIEVIQ